jgi:hypothetical protein
LHERAGSDAPRFVNAHGCVALVAQALLDMRETLRLFAQLLPNESDRSRERDVRRALHREIARRACAHRYSVDAFVSPGTPRRDDHWR